jgi:hypothetical protein
MNKRANEASTYKLAFLSCLCKPNTSLLEYGKDITPSAFARTSGGMMIGGANKMDGKGM